MSLLPFDRRNPPHEPPEGCVDPLRWVEAYWLFHEHRPDGEGVCIVCVPKKFTPCQGRHSAWRGFLASLDMESLTLPADTSDRAAQDQADAGPRGPGLE